MAYAELQVLSNFSFLRGGSHPEEYLEQAAQLGYHAIALTDLNSLAGIVRAHIAAKRHGLQLVVGSRISLLKELPAGLRPSIIDDELAEPLAIDGRPFPERYLPFSLFLYPTDIASYGRLCRLLTTGKMRAPKGKCFLLLDDIEHYQEGLWAIVAVHNSGAGSEREVIVRLKQIFGARLSLALIRSYGVKEDYRLQQIAATAKECAVPLVVANDVYYHHPERRMLQDILSCIRHRCTIEEAGFALAANAERHLKSPQEMARLFQRYPAALKRTLEIAECASGFSLDQLRYEYPHEICPAGKSPLDYLEELTWKGAAERYPTGIPAKVSEQIRYELKLIAELEYEKYFLTVYDIVEFARSQQILCQGRGAAANSAVCYCLGVTAVDPDRINLLFERFVSKERNEPPDIDIDFEHERREEVIQYIYAKYGRMRAALVAEVISYRTRSALRDVGKAFGLSLPIIETLIKLVTRDEGEPRRTSEKLNAAGLDGGDRRLLHTLKLSRVLLGFPRHLSQHVGGFIISEGDLCNLVPIENAAMPERTVIEWDKDDVDSMQMLKVDLLGLGMLTCIRKSFELVNAQRKEKLAQDLLKLHTIPPEDPSVYAMIQQADTIGVFQIESRAQMSMLPRLKPKCFYDLVIEVAIVRPGPIQGGMVHPYLRRRSGKEPITYPDERIKKILIRTLGVPIFQEQVMELAVTAAGFTPGEADQLRRAMASWKRNKNLLNAFGDRLIGGMLKNGYSREFANTLFQQIQGFGEYGFPQSHSASFALLVYVSAWLKKHYPAAFAAGLLNSQPMGFYQPAQIIQDAKRHGVSVRSVDGNESSWDCTLEGKEPALRLGMRLVRGLQERDGRELERFVRANGRYRSIVVLWRKSQISVGALRALARADAHRSIGLNRQQALWEIRKLKNERLPLIEGLERREEQALLPSLTLQQEVLKDYSTVGVSLRAHPLSFLRDRLVKQGIVTAAELRSLPQPDEGSRLAVAGLVLVRQRPGTASGIIFMTIEDETGNTNLIIKPPVFREYKDEVCDSIIIGAIGQLQREEEVIHIIVEELYNLTPALQEMASLSRDFH